MKANRHCVAGIGDPLEIQQDYLKPTVLRVEDEQLAREFEALPIDEHVLSPAGPIKQN